MYGVYMYATRRVAEKSVGEDDGGGGKDAGQLSIVLTVTQARTNYLYITSATSSPSSNLAASEPAGVVDQLPAHTHRLHVESKSFCRNRRVG